MAASIFTWAQVADHPGESAPNWDPGGLIFDNGSIRATFPIALRGLQWSGWETSAGMGSLRVSKGMEDIGRPMKPNFRWQDEPGARHLHKDLTLETRLGTCLGDVYWVPEMKSGVIAYNLPVSLWAHFDFIWTGFLGDRGERDLAALLKSARRVAPGEPIRAGEVVYAGLGFRLPWLTPPQVGSVALSGWTDGSVSGGGLDGVRRTTATFWITAAGLIPEGTPPETGPDPRLDCDVLVDGLPARETTATYVWTEGGVPMVTRTWQVVSKPGERAFSVWFGLKGVPGEPRPAVEAKAIEAWHSLLRSVVLH
jgi:hypothetical protein